MESGNITANPYVSEKTERRNFSSEQKITICQEAEKIPNGQLGAFLRKMGIYWSQFSVWRKKYQNEGEEAFKRKSLKKNQQSIKKFEAENQQLHLTIQKLTKQLKQAELIIDVQKKISEILGIQTSAENSTGEHK